MSMTRILEPRQFQPVVPLVMNKCLYCWVYPVQSTWGHVLLRWQHHTCKVELQVALCHLHRMDGFNPVGCGLARVKGEEGINLSKVADNSVVWKIAVDGSVHPLERFQIIKCIKVLSYSSDLSYGWGRPGPHHLCVVRFFIIQQLCEKRIEPCAGNCLNLRLVSLD